MNPEGLLELWRSLAEGQDVSGMDRRRLETDASVDMFACIFWPSRRLGLLIEGDGAQHPLTDRIPACRGVKVMHEVIGAKAPRTILRVMLEDEEFPRNLCSSLGGSRQRRERRTEHGRWSSAVH